ncbi:cytochrome c3 family protein [Helicobacter ailurogastricus]|uniref:Cytochrome c-type protein TorY n=1 Tax=Helicobacter ailurogastricus TaxID=1578720 RepID=A0A0K2X8L1_9HELI|nr:NapC/NirT family cytochrome c [Helicobacter ailurogastricus]CRF41059.1 Cytochrome c-type protein TorY [Helicobacter ailurogastricus]CRF42347.1 Cytochrome c-type protein TorY [Helicobacter ailurogastricus]CRF44755.1 Cytochrome c-type protein TorY [Helicobacter ailurogastricus]
MGFLRALQGKRFVLFWLFCAGCVLGVVLTVFTVQAVEWTGDDKFCGMCHIMTPEVDSYHLDKHGGHNHVGMKAECVDCHLPHDNIVHYFVEKTLLGLEDVYGNTMKNPRKFDWEMNRREAKDYVFDSGCLRCHTNLKEATQSNMKAFLPHRDYFAGLTKKHCVECHLDEVGHKNLSIHLKKFLKEDYKPTVRALIGTIQK